MKDGLGENSRCSGKRTYVLSGVECEAIVLGEGGRRDRTRAFSSYFSYNRDNIAGSKNHIRTSGFR